MAKTMFDKIWDAHEVAPGLLYIDLHLVHEVTSPQAFDGLRLAGRTVRRPDRTLGTAGGVGHVIEYAGPPIEALSMEGRMTVCNMTIEGGGRAGMIAPDETTFEWIAGRPGAPADLPSDDWLTLRSEPGAEFDTVVD